MLRLRASGKVNSFLFPSFLLLLLATSAKAQVNVATWHNDNARTGQYLAETVLTPANVNSTTFGQLFSYSVDGYVYAQPLYMANVSIPGKGTHNVVFVATQHNSVYAFDADSNAGANSTPLWSVNLGPSAATPNSDFGGRYGAYHDITPEVGITGTPVIDQNSGTLFVDAFTHEGTSYFHRLHALDITSGAEKFGGPKLVTASVPGTGEASVNGVVNFDPKQHLQRPALTLVNGVVYVAYSGYADTDPYHGWVLGYSASNLSQVKAWSDTPNGSEGGIWMSASGLSADSNNNLFLSTGNGTFDGNAGGADFGNSLLKMTTNLAVTDYFTPFNYSTLNNSDTDFGSGGVLLLPDQPGSFPHLLVTAGKEGRIYLVNRDNLGHFNSSSDQVVQSIPGAFGGRGCFDTPAYFNNTLYYIANGDLVRAFPLMNDQLSNTSTAQGNHYFNFPGASPSISANGSSNAILWALQASNPGVLYAYNASNLATELYDSNQAGARDQLAAGVKFSVPTVANGRVYAGTQSTLTVFGLLSNATSLPAAPSNLVANAISSTQVNLSWSDNSSNETAFQVERSTDNFNYQLVTSAGANSPSVSDTGLLSNTLYYYRVRATNSAGSSSYSNVASVTTLSGGANTGLVGFWKLDEGSGTMVLDSSGNNDTGTINGEVTWIAGQVGYGTALSFHGVGQAIANVTIPDAAQLRFSTTQSFTASAWASADTTGTSWADLLVKSREQGAYYGLGVDPNNRWVFFGPSAYLEGPLVTSGGWHLITGVQDGAAGTRKLYVDGVLAASGAAQAGDGPGALWFGNGASVSQPFNGSIDDVRLYNRALSSAEVQTLANTTWHDADIGSVGQPGSATYLLDGTFTLNGSGADIWGTADAFNFVYQQQSGDFQVTARVTSIENTNGFAKAGVMIRETLNANSAFAATVLTAANGIEFNARTTQGAAAIAPARLAATAPYWVRISRSGNTFTSATSSDGNNWVTLGTQTIAMAPAVYLGLAVCAHDNTQLNTSVFDNVSAAPLVTLVNSSGRANVGSAGDVAISGLIIQGTSAKKILIRGLGPSVPVPGNLDDPVLTLFDSSGQLLASNDNWQDAPNKQEIIDSALAPASSTAAAILRKLEPGAYTAILSGANGTTGIGLIELYDLDPSPSSKIVNFSTRAAVQGADNVLINGVIISGLIPQKIIVRALGPSLPVSGHLLDPVLELHNGNGDLIATNDDWTSDQQSLILATGVAPPMQLESAIIATLQPGAYTSIVRGKNNASGVVLVECFTLN